MKSELCEKNHTMFSYLNRESSPVQLIYQVSGIDGDTCGAQQGQARLNGIKGLRSYCSLLNRSSGAAAYSIEFYIVLLTVSIVYPVPLF